MSNNPEEAVHSDIKKSMRAVFGSPESRTKAQQNVYKYIRWLADRPAKRSKEGYIITNEVIAQNAVGETLKRFLQMADSKPSDENPKSKIKVNE